MKILLNETGQFGSVKPTDLLIDYDEIRSVEAFSVRGRFAEQVSRITLKGTATCFYGDDDEMYQAYVEHFVLETPAKIKGMGSQD